MKFIKTLLVTAIISGLAVTAGYTKGHGSMVKEGKKLFKTKKLGNCVSCHAVNGDKEIEKMGPGSFGPKLTGLKHWDDKTLYDTVYDIYSARNLPVTPMPAFGKNGWLNDKEIKAIVAYLKTIE